MHDTKNIKALDGIRGYAVLLVMLSHGSNDGIDLIPTISFSGAGVYGVFLFFVLSAFLLTKQMMAVFAGGGHRGESIRYYFVRRFLRIFPLFFCALLLYYALNKIGIGIFPMSLTDVARHLLLLDGVGIFWTIPVEFQYYFLLPLVSLLLFQLRDRLWLATVTVLTFVAAWSFVFPPRDAVNLVPSLPVFVLGSFFAYLNLHLERETLPAARRWLLQSFGWAAGLLFILLTPLFYNFLLGAGIERTHFHYHFLLFGLMSCVLVIGTVQGRGALAKIFESRALRFMGKISFSAYLGHMVVIKLVKLKLLAVLGPSLSFVVYFSAAILLSYLSYLLIEKPLAQPGPSNVVDAKLAKLFSLIRPARGRAAQAER